MVNQARDQRAYLDNLQGVRDAEAKLAKAETETDIAKAKEQLAKAKKALEESEQRIFPEKNDQNG